MSTIHSTFLSENPYWLSGVPKQEFYLYLELQGAEAPVVAGRVPLNLSLVIDRSGSMSGDKIAFAKKAAQFVVDNLQAEDRVSIVQYDDQIEVVSPAGPVGDKAELRRRIEIIAARNMTNLSGGLLAGYEQAESTKADRYVNRVLLLSDGLANQGITDPARLQQIVQEKFRNDGLALSTFGVGADFDEVLMTNLSEYGGANYYFIESPDRIPTIFAEELKGLLAVVGQNVKMEIQLPAAYFRCENVYGFPADITDDAVRINFNDLFSQEKKAVLLRLVALRPLDQNLEFVVTLDYDDVLETYRHVEHQQSLGLQITADASLVQRSANPVVVEQTTLFIANDLYEGIIRLADQMQFEEARKQLAQLKMYLEKHFQSMPPGEELKKLYEEILRYEQQLARIEEMSHHERLFSSKQSRSMSYSMRRKKPL
jgi:Ca-activated chloride channel family protein